MSEMCKILFSLAGGKKKASSRIRGFWIAEELERKGFHCILRWKHSKLDLIKFAFEIPRHDVVIFQKTYSRYHRWLMSFAIILGKQTYLDLDDAPSRINSPMTLNNVEAMMRMATGVFAGSNSLLEYGKKFQSNTYLIPSGVKLENYKIYPKSGFNKPVTLGWIGNGSHYKNDLIDTLTNPLKKLLAHYTIRFKLIGACGEQALHDGFKSIKGLDAVIIDNIDWVNPVHVSKEINSFDIGLYPLLPNKFNKYKCGFKAVEYMATGIPVVSSSVAVNADMIDDGLDGFLADTDDEWVTRLGQLIDDSELRREMGLAGRRKVEEFFNVATVSQNIKEILEQNTFPE